MSIKNVALLGADGKLGPAILNALISSGFSVTVLKRASSKSADEYPAGVQVAKVPDDFATHSVADVIRGQDAVVVTIKGSLIELQQNIAEACVLAGVKRFIPADFGSTDSSLQVAQDLVPLFKKKTELRDYLTRLSKDHNDFTWTSLVCGHFFDWSGDFLHVWVEKRKADILDDGDTKCSASTLSRIGEATARILLHPEKTTNRMIYVQSFCVSQNQVIKSFEKATSSSWEINKLDSERYSKEQKAKADQGEVGAVDNLVWLLGTLYANWEIRDGFAMEALGLENEDLDEVVKRVVKESA